MTADKMLTGQVVQANIITQQPFVPQFASDSQLENLSFAEDINLQADGAGSSQWGYTRQIGNLTQYLLFTYSVEPTKNNDNAPVEFNCPCNTTISVFVGE